MSKEKYKNVSYGNISDYEAVPIYTPDYKTEIILGEGESTVAWYLTKQFNWFQKKMLELCFGFKVNDIN